MSPTLVPQDFQNLEPRTQNLLVCVNLTPVFLRGLSFILSACFAVGCSAPKKITVTAVVQMEVGGQPREVEMEVHPVPVNPDSLPARDADLEDGEIVLGIVQDGKPMAYPIRYLALSEVLNDRVGQVSLAPTW